MIAAARENWDIFATQFRVSLASSFQYRMSIVLSFVSFVAEPIIYVVVWQTVARQSGGNVGGFGVAEFAAYFIAWTFVRQITGAWGFAYVEWRIRRGDFSPLLLRPTYPWLPDLTQMLAAKVVSLIAVLPTLIALALLFRPRFEATPFSLAASIPALVAGFLLRYVLAYALALLAFHTTRIAWLNNLWTAVEIFTSGRIAPLDLLPPWALAIANALPFRWMFYFPLEVMLGRLSPPEALRGAAIQLGWLAFSIALFNVIWRTGVRRYTAVGG